MKQSIVAVMLLAFLLTGCQTGGYSSGSVMSENQVARPAPIPQIQNLGANPVYLNPGGRSVLVSCTNTTGVSLMDPYQEAIEAELVAKGYIIVDSVEQADYKLKCQLTYFDLLSKRSDSAELQNLVLSSAGATIGGAIGANNHNPWLGAFGGGLIGLGISEVINNSNRKIVYYIDFSIQIDERIDFIGAEPSEPIITIDQTTIDVKKTKNGKVSKKSIEVNTENAHLQSPIETTTSTSHSGNNNVKSVSGTRAAKFQSHETSFKAAIQFPSKQLPDDLSYVINSVAKSIAGNFGRASRP